MSGDPVVFGNLYPCSISMLDVFRSGVLSFFFFNDTATTEIYALSLHDALPISRAHAARRDDPAGVRRAPRRRARHRRSEEHTSELQSQSNIVCRLLLEKKKLHSLICLSTCRCVIVLLRTCSVLTIHLRRFRLLT